MLRESGLMVDEVRGRRRLYSLDTAPLRPLKAGLARLRGRWTSPLDALETEVYRPRRDRLSAISSQPRKKQA